MARTENFTTSSGQTYHVNFRGQGLALFALHGFSENLQTWDHLNLSNWQIISLDLIVHGESDKPEKIEPYQLSNILTDLREIIEHYRRGQNFVLLGYSMGGRLALNYALDFPENLTYLILESASPGILSESDRLARRQADEKLAEKIEQNGSTWFADFWKNQTIFSSQKRLPEQVQRDIWQMRADNLPSALAETLRATGQGNLPYLAHRLSELKMPILYLSGELDSKYSRIAKEIFQPLKKVKHIMVPNCGHNIHLEAPQLFSEILQKELHRENH